MNCRRRWLCECAAIRSRERTSTLLRLASLAFVVGLTGAVIASPPFAQASDQSVYGAGLFELGDAGLPFGYPGAADILVSDDQAGPDWAELFTAEGKLRDEWPLDDAGLPLGNGIPDYVDRYGGDWAVFTADDISLGTGAESTALTADGKVENGTAEPEHDIGNAYFYSTKDGAENVVLFAGAERLDSGDSELEIEVNQAHIRLGHGGYGADVPWEILGGRTAGDLLLRLTFAGGQLAGVHASAWDGASWGVLDSLTGEGCNGAETLCAISNDLAIDGGPWPNHDTGDDPERVGAQRFVEVGVNAGALLGAQPDYLSIQFRTPQDIAFGHLREGN